MILFLIYRPAIFITFTKTFFMKRFFIFFLTFVFIQINSFAKQRELNKGESVIFGTDVLLLNIPSTKGNILDALPIASKIEIIDKASLLTTIGNISDFWYKVKYNDTEGYVWGTSIADNFYENDIDKDGSTETFMILNLTKSVNEEGYNYNNSKLEFRIARNGQLIHEHKRFTNYSFICDSIKYETSDKFNSKINLLSIAYNFTGETSGKAEQFFSFNKDNLDSLFTIAYLEKESAYISYGNLIFPKDKDGIKNSIIINYKFCNDTSNCNDEHGIPCKWEFTKEILEWDGKKFILKK